MSRKHFKHGSGENLRSEQDISAFPPHLQAGPGSSGKSGGVAAVAKTHSPVRVAALYKFAPLGDCKAVRHDLAQLCCAEGLKGTLLVAGEGINGTIAGRETAIENLLAFIRAVPGFADLDVKYSAAETMPFHRMKVRVKREIVTMGQPQIDPLAGTGHYVSPQDWNALISAPDTIVIDTRNDYEVAIGSFAGAIDPGTASFRDFPAWFRAERERLLEHAERPPRIAMFCTGGIRCEKSTAFLKAEGIDEVYHLQGGILNYLERVPADQSLWEGECFVFDQRVAVGHGLELGTHALCHGCRRPVSAQERTSPHYVAGVSCPACHGERSDSQKAGYAERDRQERLARSRGTAHIGAGQRDG